MPLNRTIQGVRGSVPGGYILGRTANADDGPVQLLSMHELAAMMPAQPQGAGGGGSGGSGLFSQTMSAKPTTTQTGTSWFHQTVGSTVANGTAGVNLYLPGNGSNDIISALEISAPASPYSISVLLSSIRVDNGCQPVFGFSDGTKYEGWFDSTSHYGIYKFSAYNSAVGFQQSETNNGVNKVQLYWWKIYDDGANINFYDSPDGAFWRSFYSVAYASSYIGSEPTKVLIGGDAYDTAMYISVLSWSQGVS